MTGVLGMPHRSQCFTAEELARLRYLVRCTHCGAVPTEQQDEDGSVITREVGNGYGGTVSLPIVVTPHTEFCVHAPKVRPRKTERRYPVQDAGPCGACRAPMVAAKGRLRKYCGSTCRSRAAAQGRPTQPAGPCTVCSDAMVQGPNKPRKYCSTRCASTAARNQKRSGASS